MAREPKKAWQENSFNLWAIVAVVLGFTNFLLILLLWNVSGGIRKINSLAVSVTILEIFLFVIAVGGFWVIRGAAISAAEAEARSTAEEIAPPVARRAALAHMSYSEQQGGSDGSTNSMDDMLAAFDRNGEGGENEG